MILKLDIYLNFHFYILGFFLCVSTVHYFRIFQLRCDERMHKNFANLFSNCHTVKKTARNPLTLEQWALA